MKIKQFLPIIAGLVVASTTGIAIAATQPAKVTPKVAVVPVEQVAPAPVAEPQAEAVVPTPEPVVQTPSSIAKGNGTNAPRTATGPNYSVKADNFDNMCYRMDDGTFTTVIIKDFEPSPNIFAYGGPLDEHDAPANFPDAQAWCAAHYQGAVQ